MTTGNSSTDLTDQISPTLALDIAIKEIDQSGHDDERMVLAFNALDQIIPQLGVFSPLVANLRNEFFDCVYSNQFTVEQIQNKASRKRKRIACIERLSYKVLCERLIDEQQYQLSVFENKMSDVETNLAEKNRDLNQSFEKIQQIENAKQKLMNELSAMRTTLNEKDKLIETLKEECERTRFNCEQEIYNTQLKENQATTEALIDELSKYKQGFDQMEEAFMDSSSHRPSGKKDGNQVENQEEPFVQVKNQLMLDIQVAIRLEEQMLTLLNMTTEEYDQILDDEHNKLLKMEEDLSEAQFVKDNINSEQQRYVAAIKEIREEIDIMQRHRRSLEDKLEIVVLKNNEELRNRKATVAFVANEAAQKTGKPSNPLFGLERAFETANRRTDLIEYAPQERILSRFSCKLASSSNGQAWTDFESVSYCDSCADYTYLCPHKFPEDQTIVRVPDGTKYILISRPILKYNESLIRKVMNDNKKLINQMLPPIYQQNNASVMRTNYPGNFIVDKTSRKQENVSNAGLLIHTFDRVWEDYKKRTNIERLVPRPFSVERLFSMITEILVYECNADERLANVTGNILDDVYVAFNNRYADIDKIPYNAIHDFFTSIVAYKSDYKIFELFMHILIGNMDVTCIYYISLLGDILDKIVWYETDDIRIFFKNIYPFLDDDGLDTVIIDFVSYTENRISRFLAIEYIISLLLKGNEPVYQEMQYKLSLESSANFDMMNEEEFRTGMENIAYSVDERLFTRFFDRAERHSHSNNLKKGFVLMPKLAHIASFFYFKQFIEEQTGPLDEKIQNEINLNKKSEAEYKSRTRKQVVDEKLELIKYSKVKSLGNILYESTNSEILSNVSKYTANEDISAS
ncbi:unnamed protein product [Adineta steineri]|uniref:Uncharacterized protein n=1 Tax=Adineta steineri TaxID=433720 RepID=A0A815QYH8_9BILA|nr:unnamed protein product [Adineta steineri]CAF3777497.1 unnamed protein product [Adineta steineri]